MMVELSSGKLTNVATEITFVQLAYLMPNFYISPDTKVLSHFVPLLVSCRPEHLVNSCVHEQILLDEDKN